MGCCVSTGKTSKRRPNPSNPQHLPHPEETHVRDTNDRDPPPSIEEETVKEVLSETAIPKPVATVVVEEHKSEVEEEEEEEERIETKAVLSRAEEVSEVSQVSEICSLSESLETTTFGEDEAASRDYVDRDGEVRQRAAGSLPKVVRKRSFPGELAGEKERRVRSSVARKPVPSPEKRNRTTSQAAARQRSAGPAGVRRDPGEASGRRSRSPVTRAEGGASRAVRSRSPTVKTTGRAGGASTDVAEEKSSNLEKSEERDFPVTNETLENPLVSLECFIFL